MPDAPLSPPPPSAPLSGHYQSPIGNVRDLMRLLFHWVNYQHAVSQGWVANPQASYQTQLPPAQQAQFQGAVQQGQLMGKHPDLSRTGDYDYPGWYQAYLAGDPRAQMSMSGVDAHPHFDDTWKTPYHESLSRNSMYSTPSAPDWQGNVQFAPNGAISFDEPMVHAGRTAGLPEAQVRQWFTQPPLPPTPSDMEQPVTSQRMLSLFGK